MHSSKKIAGKIIDLIPAPLDAGRTVYQWCFHSETTKSHSGPPHYPNVRIPDYAEFCEDYADFYFTGCAPQKGQGFLITHNAAPVGFISYAAFHLRPQMAEIDIWMSSEAHCGKGFGTDALVALGDYLRDEIGIAQLIIRPSKTNHRAIRAYQKAGFAPADAQPSAYILAEYPDEYAAGDYGVGGDVLLVKVLGDGCA